jgi:hypothetical protein
MDDSPLWKDMIKVRHIYLQGREYQIHNGRVLVFGWINGYEINLNVLCTLFYMMPAPIKIALFMILLRQSGWWSLGSD